MNIMDDDFCALRDASPAPEITAARTARRAINHRRNGASASRSAISAATCSGTRGRTR